MVSNVEVPLSFYTTVLLVAYQLAELDCSDEIACGVDGHCLHHLEF